MEPSVKDFYAIQVKKKKNREKIMAMNIWFNSIPTSTKVKDLWFN